VSVPIPTVPDAPLPQIMYADVPPMNMQMGLADLQVWTSLMPPLTGSDCDVCREHAACHPQIFTLFTFNRQFLVIFLFLFYFCLQFILRELLILV